MQTLQQQIDRLAEFEPVELPVISLYLDTRPDQHGRDNFDRFIQDELAARVDTFPAHSPERESYERDVERIRAWLADELRPASNGVALFACAGADDFFEAVQLEAPLDRHRLYVYTQPHLYHLAHINDEYPRYAALVVDTNSARIFVFALGARQREESVENRKVRQSQAGGWSQARYQRRHENAFQQHAKEVVETLERVVREDDIKYIILAGDEVIIPVLRDQLPKALAEKVVDVLHLDISAPEHEVLTATLESMRQVDATEDDEKVRRLLDAYRSGGLGVTGVEATLEALTRGQVDELLIGASLERREPAPRPVDLAVLPDIPPAPPGMGEQNLDAPVLDVRDQLVTQARATGATVTFIEESSDLDRVGGVGALLRFKL
jgi:peptide subunit release factor 1 (eRF1)